MELIVNGEARTLEVHILSELARALALPERGVAVAVDDAVVPRTRWDATPLRPHQRIEILTAVQGG